MKIGAARPFSSTEGAHAEIMQDCISTNVKKMITFEMFLYLVKAPSLIQNPTVSCSLHFFLFFCSPPCRDEASAKSAFFQHLVEDRSESASSYYEFLQHIQQQLSKQAPITLRETSVFKPRREKGFSASQSENQRQPLTDTHRSFRQVLARLVKSDTVKEIHPRSSLVSRDLTIRKGSRRIVVEKIKSTENENEGRGFVPLQNEILNLSSLPLNHCHTPIYPLVKSIDAEKRRGKSSQEDATSARFSSSCFLVFFVSLTCSQCCFFFIYNLFPSSLPRDYFEYTGEQNRAFLLLFVFLACAFEIRNACHRLTVCCQSEERQPCKRKIIGQWLDVEKPPCRLFSPPLCELLICRDQTSNPPPLSTVFFSFVLFFQALTEVAIHFVTIEKNLLCAIIYEPAY